MGQLTPEIIAPPDLTALFPEALTYAVDAHRSQLRKGTAIPYVSHLLAVAAIVLEHGGTEDEAIAALLHDTIEDAGGDSARQEIRRRFGDVVVAIVDGCTDAETIPKSPWEERKRAYIAHLTGARPSVLLVSSADKLHNARSILADYREIGEELWPRFNGGRDGTLWYYRELANRFSQLRPSPLSEELERVVSELEHQASS